LLAVAFGYGERHKPAPAPPVRPAQAKPSPVRLAVVLVFDQMRPDYLTRWDPLFAADGGVHRLEKYGAWFTNCNYPYGTTVTGAGHATLSTGCLPSQHGIIANEWYRHDNLSLVYCAANPERHRVPPSEDRSRKPDDTGAGSPENLEAATIGEALKAVHEGNASKPRVFALSAKDRSAVLLAGHNADGVYWFDTNTGTFVTSDYYRDSLHSWVREFNAGRPADAWFGKDWLPLRPDADKKLYWSELTKGAGEGFKQGLEFPHKINAGLDKPGRSYYDAMTNSPFGNDLLLALAKKAIESEKLGSRETPDLLLLSFSSNDLIGHVWGPDSAEVLDVTLRTDLLLKDLLGYLDQAVGKDKYLVVLSADHGVCPLPEVTAARKKAHPSLPLPDANRVDLDALKKEAEAFLHQKFVDPADTKIVCVARFAENTFYLNPQWLRQSGLKGEAVESALADWLAARPGILTAYTRTSLLNGSIPAGDEIGQKVMHSFHPARSGDVIFVLQPYWWVTTEKYKTGTGHGTPHDYDTNVPFLVYGPGVRPGVRTEAVTPLAAVPILAKALNITPPQTATAPVPPKLFAD
jgi:predicted AlkP superfamily pyrophosphatase or phosphodiesterase